MSTPAVMVSSTFYDLSQVREDLREFLQDEVGYRPLLSEHPSFPIDPDADTIENCRRRVEQDADVLVLIVGGRYGYVDQASDKSVTNLEYLAARAKGIPIYVFADRGVLAVLPVWKNNPEADFSGTVDSPRLFEFLDQVRSTDRVWTQSFGRAQDIVGALRVQFAHLTSEGLQWGRRLRGTPPRELRDLHGEALRLALEKPDAWEYLLFGRVLCDEIEASEDLLREYRLGILLGTGEQASGGDLEMLRWLGRQFAELRRTYAAADTLINVALQEALGRPGEPGDVAALVFVARQFGAAYRHAVDWSQRVRRAHTSERFEVLTDLLSKLSQSLVEQVGGFGPNLLHQVNEALANPPGPGEPPPEIRITLTFELSGFARFREEFDRIMKEYE